MPKVFIIVLNWNQTKDTLECLESLKKINYHDHKVIVVDNGSLKDPTNIIRKKFPRIKVIRNKKNLGFAGGNNMGIKQALEAKVDYVFILNNDTVVHSQVLTRLVKVAEEDKKVAILGPQIFYYNKPKKIWFLRANLTWPMAKINIWNQNKPSPNSKKKLLNTDYVAGAAMLIRTDVIKKLGAFDPYYFLYWEDIDLCVRFAKAGYKIRALTNAYVWHKVSTTTNKINEKNSFFMVRNRLYFCRKYNNFLNFWVKVFLIIFVSRVWKLVYNRFDNHSIAGFHGLLSYFKEPKKLEKNLIINKL
ncbi:glycosyltransferase family 2 protein [Candidatus Beckwithbacteria bacterium CG10_big_fil_rev_8_21_14_0_10_34_10]|uniref:Glycosyltransferase family 2 protein n=1 Tax=Candidatus Beckwithbacteria bacterium CG10_big_fil_rev_8_21_14_0_10_34_10 TaxID=1974495 RepID=A0A2H0W9F7_9BACT|nr:MAG: glycosyltransferase family 2 protein [Candidatus Beckwithbacteria bacterium CG10_big_fil_rev_8_21_14_0_10_34_10]